MVTKLKSVLRNPTLRLAFKALIFGVSLFFVASKEFGIVPILIFLAIALILYTRPLFRTFEMVAPFGIILPISLLMAELTFGGRYFFVTAIYFSFLFAVLIGIKDLILIKREVWHRVLNLALAYPVFLLFFFHSQNNYYLKLFIVFLAIFFLVKDLIKKRFLIWLAAFLMLESVWAIGILPFGFIGAANLALLIYFTLTDVLILYSIGRINRSRTLTAITLFVLLTLLFFAFSRWSL